MEPDSDEDGGYGDLYSDTDSENEEEESGADCGCDGRGGTDNTREQEVAVSGQCQDSPHNMQCPSLVLRPGPCRPAGWPRLGGAPAAARAAAGEDGEDGGRGQEAGAQPDGGGQPLMQRGGYIRLQVTPHLLCAVL